MMNVVRGINFSAVDENLHAVGGAALFQQHKKELNLDVVQEEIVKNKIHQICHSILEHECRIVDMIFEKGKIDGVTDTQLKHFVESRINLCLRNLGYNNLYEVKYNPIADWFYNGLNNFQYVDFFSGQGREYQRDWDEDSLGWEV
jgi:ribonucleotide reductase beta subunit family protein with ferritin-like domain